MARAQDQKRWRDKTPRRRIEAYLPVDVAERLDEYAARQGQTRAAVVTAMIDDALAVEPVQQAVATPEPAETPPEAPEPAAAAPAGDVIGYKLRRPRTAEEKRYKWVADTDAGERIALGPDPVRHYKWVGRYLSGSLFSRDAKGQSRDAVVRDLIDRDYLYR